jgi:hypothetical protein
VDVILTWNVNYIRWNSRLVNKLKPKRGILAKKEQGLKRIMSSVSPSYISVNHACHLSLTNPAFPFRVCGLDLKM